MSIAKRSKQQPDHAVIFFYFSQNCSFFGVSKHQLTFIATKNALLSEKYSYYTTRILNMSNDLRSKNKKITTTLDRAEIGQNYVIISNSLSEPFKTRLAEMGLVSSTLVTVIQRAPLGDPIQITARNYSLCLRAETARHFLLRLV